ncbi:hypothetical protein GXP70_10900 [Paenibacillus lycopersici]|uniref:Rhamnogalacturonase A/B/Epimerase-like pectate lyase domain-containing protein n=1 Tax=Paenibacillus lycopersici TaxID=2704462 RepID=A0A6C0G5L5_9BACL|nr:glycosyl hydrolase family 28-related protein [Paenibacillus lycopersici]QHT60395.1 hypothetical protein GXP70_10900 [Paenibacillus lycopersici]
MQDDKAGVQAMQALNSTHVLPQWFGAVGDGKTDDTQLIQKALDYAAENGLKGIRLPPTASGYLISGQINVPSHIEILGNGTLITTASNAGKIRNIFYATGKSDITISGFRFSSTNDQSRLSGRVGSSSNIIAVRFSNCSDCEASDLYGEKLEYLIKADTNSARIRLKELTTVFTHQPIYIGDSDYLYFENLYLGMPLQTETDNHDHGIYMEAVNYVQGSNIVFVGGNGHALHIYNLRGITTHDINITNLIFQNIRGAIIASTCGRVNIANVTIDGVESTIDDQICRVIDSRDAELIVANVQVNNVRQLKGGAIFNCGKFSASDGTVRSLLQINGGYVGPLDQSIGNISMCQEGATELFLNDLYFDRCEAQIFSNVGAKNKRIVVSNCVFKRNSSSTTSPASSIIFRLRGTEFAEINSCTFINDQDNSTVPIFNCTDDTGIVLIRDNNFKGDAVITSYLDTKSLILPNNRMFDGLNWIDPKVIVSKLPVSTASNRGERMIVKGGSDSNDLIYVSVQKKDGSHGFVRLNTDEETILHSPNGLVYTLQVSDSGQLSSRSDTVVYDFYDRSNNNASLGSTSSGTQWSSVIGVFGISNNTAYSVTDANRDMAVVPAVVTNYAVTCNLKGAVSDIANNSRPGIVVRYADSSNYFYAILDHNRVRLVKVDSGLSTDLASGSYPLNDNQYYSLKLACSGNSIKVLINDSLLNTYIMSTNDFEKFGLLNGVGIRLSKTGSPKSAARWNRFVVDRL